MVLPKELHAEHVVEHAPHVRAYARLNAAVEVMPLVDHRLADHHVRVDARLHMQRPMPQVHHVLNALEAAVSIVVVHLVKVRRVDAVAVVVIAARLVKVHVAEVVLRVLVDVMDVLAHAEEAAVQHLEEVLEVSQEAHVTGHVADVPTRVKIL